MKSDDGPDVVDLDMLYRVALARGQDHRAKVSISEESTNPHALPVVGVVVVTVHAALIWVLLGASEARPAQGTRVKELPETTVAFIGRLRVPELALLPAVQLEFPRIDISPISNVTFAYPDAGLVPGIIGPASAPRPDPAVVVDPTPYALRAGLDTGEAVTVVLAVEVLVDGSVGEVIVLIGTGNSRIDFAAVDYARSLRWIPATINRRATVTRINFPVTLTSS